MKTCPRCKAKNEDEYMYCSKCNGPLPPKYRLDSYRKKGYNQLKSGDIREARKTLELLLSKDPGDKEAWTMMAIIYRRLNLFNDMKEALDEAGIRYASRGCLKCDGLGICPDCGGKKVCLMCNGSGRCHMCRGSGQCSACGGVGGSCNVCGGTGQCTRCNGTGECCYCGGTGACGKCHGDGICPYCGGTRYEVKVNIATVPPRYKKFFMGGG